MKRTPRASYTRILLKQIQMSYAHFNSGLEQMEHPRAKSKHTPMQVERGKNENSLKSCAVFTANVTPDVPSKLEDIL